MFLYTLRLHFRYLGKVGLPGHRLVGLMVGEEIKKRIRWSDMWCKWASEDVTDLGQKCDKMLKCRRSNERWNIVD